MASFALTDTADTRLGKVYAEFKDDKLDDSGFFLLENGLDAFTARLILIQEADRSIDVQYYMIHNDLTGILFMNELLQAADRGIRVRLLIDDMDLEGRDASLSLLATHPSIELRIFNPFSRNTYRVVQYISRFGSVTRRMHNKSITVDNQISVVGGRNIGNEYFDANPSLVFGDLDVMAIGPIVNEVSRSFDQYWNNERAYPIHILRREPVDENAFEEGRRRLAEYLSRGFVAKYQKSLLNSSFAELIRDDGLIFNLGTGEVLSDDPEKLSSYKRTKQYSLAHQLSPYFEDIKRELLIFSPYFVPGEAGTKYLTDLSRSGVRVRIITNSLSSTDVGLVHAGYSKYRRALLRAGVELYEVNKSLSKEGLKEREIKGKKGSKVSLHAKSFILDRGRVFIGSLNFDPRSVTENTEIGIMMTSKEVAKRMVDIFDIVARQQTFRLELKTADDGLELISWHGLKDGKEHTWNFDPFTSFIQRLVIGFAGLLPIESQL